MLPRWHIFWGILFTIIFKILAPNLSFFNLSVIFLSSVLIDFDHYLASIPKTKSLSLRKAVNHNLVLRDKVILEKDKGNKIKGDFHIFHTLEFHILIGILAIFFNLFFFIFIGMIFHTLFDLIWMVNKDMLHSREFFIFNKFRMFFY